MLKALILSTLAAALSSALIATANANLTAKIGWGCHTCGFKNGTQITGIAPGSASVGTIGALILASGEFVDLR